MYERRKVKCNLSPPLDEFKVIQKNLERYKEGGSFYVKSMG